MDTEFTPEKYRKLVQANEALNLCKTGYKTIVFIYTPPKVGSTSLVSSLRLFCSNKFDIVHIHDEEMLKILGSIEGITVNELIQFNKHIGKNVYVIDVYRSPIERKISAYFEKIGCYHFNNTDSSVNNYNVQKVINRFNNIFPWIATGDHFLDVYNLPPDVKPNSFDFQEKYMLVQHNGIHYLKLRLKDSQIWGSILTKVFVTPIESVRDYESSNKPIRDLYHRFKSDYKIPSNLLQSIAECPHFQYYYSAEEQTEYLQSWRMKIGPEWISYSKEEYLLYEKITMENCHIDSIQKVHYLDEGCLCRVCQMKRKNLTSRLLSKQHIGELRVIHEEARNEMLQRKVVQVQKINNMIKSSQLKKPGKFRGKNFNSEMNNIVTLNGKR